MAKGNFFLGQAKGKVGSVVFSRAFGQQITRTKPTSVRNPKTAGQNTQRAILATIAKEAAMMTGLVDHSFANVNYGPDSVRHFRKINLGILRNSLLSSRAAWYNITPKGGNALPNYLKISEGSLPAFSVGVSAADSSVAFYQNAGASFEEDATVGNFKSAYPYIQGGDQLTLVKIVKTAGTLEDGDASFIMKLDRIVFAPNAFDDDAASFMSAGIINPALLDLTKTTDADCLVHVTGSAGNGLGFTLDDNVYAAALILSRKVNNVWQRSTQFLEQTAFNDYADNQAAIDSYGESASLADATEYLNQADESTASSGVSGAYMNVTTTIGKGSPAMESVNAGSTKTKAASGASGTNLAISAQAFAPTGKRIVAVEIDRPDGSYAAHGASSVNYNLAITQKTAGNWKIVALYDDGTKAEYVIAVDTEG